MTIRIEIAGALNDAGDQRCFGQRDRLQVLVEVSACCLGEADDRERAALSEVHLIGIELKNLLLAEFLFQLEGDEHFGDLALHRLLRR